MKRLLIGIVTGLLLIGSHGDGCASPFTLSFEVTGFQDLYGGKNPIIPPDLTVSGTKSMAPYLQVILLDRSS